MKTSEKANRTEYIYRQANKTQLYPIFFYIYKKYFTIFVLI